jgi:excisionase family DNA binding protein
VAIESERLLTVQEVAERLHVHPITVRRLIANGRLAAIRIGRAVRVREEDVGAFLRPKAPPSTKLPYRWPPTPEDMERRRKIAEEMRALRDSMPPLGISTAELVRESRRELEERDERRARGRR